MRGLRCLLLLDGSGYDTLQLLSGKEVFPVFILTLKLIIRGFDGGLLLHQFTHLIFEDLHLSTLLLSASHSALSVLESLSGLLILVGILTVVIIAASIDDLLLQILLLFLGNVCE